MEALRARDVSVRIGRRTVVTGIDLDADAGDVVVVVGPNGSGKSTFLKALAGERGYSGSILLNGRELSSLKPQEAALMRAVLPQSSTLSFPFTVREVVRLGLMAGGAGRSREEQARLADRALAMVDLSGFAGRFYQELSGGEQQRVHLARVLLQVWEPVVEGAPRLLLLDEPVSSLDIRHQLLVMRVAADFARRGGAVVVVLHDLNLAAMFATRVLAMSRGRLAASGRAGDVFSDRILAEVFECDMKVGAVPQGVPFVLPQTAQSEVP